MSKSKNTIDPETMINQYIDAVRWFILSDSPMQDVQWSIKASHQLINFYKKFGT